MDLAERQKAVLFLDGIISRLQSAQSGADRQAAMKELAGGLDKLVNVPFVPPMIVEAMAAHFAGKVSSVSAQEVEADILPGLRKFREHFARTEVGGSPPGEPPRSPENRPTRPGCFGGSVLALLGLVLPVSGK